MNAIKINQFTTITKLSILLLLGVLIFAVEANATNRTWDGGGATNDWSDAMNWSDDTVPGSSDKAIFDGTSTKNCTIDSNISVNQIEINSGYAGTISQDSVVTVNSTFVQSGGTFAGGNANMDFKSIFTVSGGTFTSTTGTAFFASSFTIGSGGTFNHNNGTVQIYGSFGSLNVDSSEQFNDFEYNKTSGQGLSIASNDTVVVNGDLHLMNGNLSGSGTIQALGDVTVDSNFSGGSGGLKIAGNSTRTIIIEAGAELPNVILNAPNATINTTGSGTITFDNNLDIQNINNLSNGAVDFVVEGIFTQSGGTFMQGSGTMTFLAAYNQTGGNFEGGSAFLDFKGTFTVPGGTFTSTTGIAFFASNFTVGSGGTFNHNNGTVQFYSTFGAINVDSSLQFNDFDINKSPTGNVSAGTNDTLIVNGTLDLKQGKFNGTGARKIQAFGDVSVDTNFGGGTGTIEIAGNATRTVTFEGGSTIPNLIVNAPNVDINTTGSGTVKFDVSLDVQSVNSFANGAVNFTIDGTYTQTGGTFTQGSGFVDFAGAFTQSAGTFTGGSGNITFQTSFNLNGGSFTATSATTFVNFGFTVQSGATFDHNNGTVRFTGVSGSYNVDSSLQFNNVEFNKHPSSNISISTNDTLIVNGTLSLNEGSISGSSGAKIQVQGDLVINPNFVSSINLVEFSFEGNAVQTVTDNGGTKPTGIWTLDKSGGTVNLATDFALTNTTNVFNFTNGTITTNAFTFDLGNKNTTSGGGYVIGNLQRSYTSTGSKDFDVGTANGYSPVGVEVTTLTTNPSSMTVAAIEGTHPNSPSPANSLGRYWNLTETGDLAAILTFNYLDGDVPGTVTENELELKRYTGSGLVMFDTIPATIDDVANTITTDNSITDFSNWTAFKLAPTAAVVDVGGRVLTGKGRGIPRAFISITDQNGNIRSMMTNPFGFYRFRNIEVGQIYAISVSHKSYQFMDPTRVIMINDAISDLNFTAQNIVTTKGSVSIEGRISDVKGNGIGGIKLKLSGGSLIKPVYAETDKQGRYVFEDIKVGNTYILTPQSKRFIFSEPTKIIYLEDFLSGVDFKIE